MRRPLCLFVISFAVVSFLIQMLVASPLSGATPEGSPGLTGGTQIYLTGRLHKKEIKNNRLIYYLKDVSVAETNLKSNSNKNSKEHSTQIPTQNNIWDRQQRGAICYMTGESSGLEAVSVSEGFSVHPVGCWLHIRGTALPFDRAENDGQFDAAEYYESIGYGLRLWDGEVLSHGEIYDFWGEFLVNIKISSISRLQRYMQPEHAGILSAMLFGDKTSMDAEIKNLYRKNGIAHVLAISGLHISLLGMMGYRILRRLRIPPRLCSLLGMFLVLVYIKMIGFGISSFRAVCMFVLYMLADLLGRTYDLKTALAFSALLLLADDPATLSQAGFLLSYLAVLSLAVVNPVLQADSKRRMEFERQQRRRSSHPVREFGRRIFTALRSSLLAGFSVQVLLFPITLWFYYEFPPYSFFLNLMVIPCMSVVLISGIIGTLPLPGCGFALGAADAILSFYEWLCNLTEELPGALIVTGRPAVWQMVIYYGLIMLWLVCESRSREIQHWDIQRRGLRSPRFRGIWFGGRSFLLPRFCFPLLCMLIFFVPVHHENRVDMLSVGQGDCICIRDSKGHVALVDGGSTDVSDVGEYRLLPYLKYHGISEIDVVFLSHAHKDHYSAICELLATEGKEGVRIRTLCLTEYGLEEIVSPARRAGCEIVYLSAGDVVSCGEMEFTVVYPDVSGGDVSEDNVSEDNGSLMFATGGEGVSADENDRSMVLLGTLDRFSMLFTGDASSACDAEVIRSLRDMGVQKINCLKVAHHGARTSTGAELLEAFDFDVALISCGKDNSYGHPHEALLERLRAAGCKVFVTAESGQVGVRIGKETVLDTFE